MLSAHCSLILSMDFKLQIFFSFFFRNVLIVLSMKCTHILSLFHVQACVSTSVCVSVYVMYTFVRFQVILHLIGAFASILKIVSYKYW